ncbi:hypothetical protein FDG2_1884 [Candidatus Protofrankia californiensis]|uniref:Uncharacterized protein n=1 Tax=Candidatus Protofrankia californiensis TaxID=1839754 RepID=A0A1C3NWL7_9ACTN|nr:hypothetical protein FDG2_1884 [Candidatus Protofrankia californiensis]
MTSIDRARRRLRVAADIVDRLTGTDIDLTITVRSGHHETIPMIDIRVTGNGAQSRSRAADERRLTGIDAFAREFGLTLIATEATDGEGGLWVQAEFTHERVGVEVYTLLRDPAVMAEAHDRYTPSTGTGPDR